MALFASAALLAAPVAARASVIGSGLSGVSSPVGCGYGSQCILTQGNLHGDPNNNVVPRAGWITGFTVRDVTGDFKFMVLRMASDDSLSVVDWTSYLSGSGSDELQRFTITPSGMQVQAGDFIALGLASGATVGARDASGESGTNFWELADTDPPSFLTLDRRGELFLHATFGLVPDPLASLRVGMRPHITLSHKAVRASKKRVVTIRMRNSNAYRVKGKLTLSFKGFRKTKRFSLAKKSSKKVRFKLSRKAARRLASRRKVRAKLKARFRGPIGKTGTASARITVKAPKVRKRHGGNGGNGGNGGILPPGCHWEIQQDASGWPHEMVVCS